MKTFLTSISQKKWTVFFTAFPIMLVLDQWTKYLIHSKFSWGESLVLIDSILALTYVRNTGAAFGLFNNAPSFLREPFFIIIPILAIGAISYLLYTLPSSEKWNFWGYTLILTGAFGNLLDRIRLGYVVDFLDFHWKEVYHWPAFNVADSCIVIGVGILFFLSLKSSRGSS
jgi:signal peptidase II